MKQNNNHMLKSRMGRLMAENIMRNVMIRMTGSRDAMIDCHGVMKLPDGKALSIVNDQDGHAGIIIIDNGSKRGSVPIDYDDPDETVGMLVRSI